MEQQRATRLLLWTELNFPEREAQFSLINASFKEALEIVEISMNSRGTVISYEFSNTATLLCRSAWGIAKRCQVLYRFIERESRLRAALGIYSMADLIESLEINNSLFECHRTILEDETRQERHIRVAVLEVLEALNAYLEISFQQTQHPNRLLKYLSPPTLRVLNDFDPTISSAKRKFCPLLFTGAFETNRRRH